MLHGNVAMLDFLLVTGQNLVLFVRTVEQKEDHYLEPIGPVVVIQEE